MKIKSTFFGVKAFLGLIVFILLTGNFFALVFANDIIVVYQQPNPDTKSASLNYSIVDGAGYFLNSYSDFLLLLNRVEMSGKQSFDYTEAGLIASRTIKKMENLKSTYLLIIKQTAGAEYNTDVLKMLEIFDYQGLQEKAALNPVILNEVKTYLIKGDIAGIFSKIVNETGQLLAGLNEVQKQIESGIFPDINGLWRLNQKYAEMMLFGQYVSMICNEIKN